MPASDFTFISPGVQVQEIDRSGIPAEAPPIGPAVIGRSVRGPSMTPVRLESTADLYKNLWRSVAWRQRWRCVA